MPRSSGSSRAAAVDLVDEDQRRDPQALQRAHQHARLRLHALDGGDDEHRAVEHAEHPLDLGDEVGVAGGVDQVDGDAADGERHDRGLDRDAAPALERQGVGLGAAVVDAADLVDDAAACSSRSVRLVLPASTCARMPRFKDSHCASCPPRGSGWGWTCALPAWWVLLLGSGGCANRKRYGTRHRCLGSATSPSLDTAPQRAPGGAAAGVERAPRAGLLADGEGDRDARRPATPRRRGRPVRRRAASSRACRRRRVRGAFSPSPAGGRRGARGRGARAARDRGPLGSRARARRSAWPTRFAPCWT